MTITQEIITLRGDRRPDWSLNNSWREIPELFFPVQAGKIYHVRATVIHAGNSAIGTRIGFAADPTTAPTLMAMFAYQPDGIGTLDGGGHDDYVTVGATTGGYTVPAASPDMTGSVLITEGIIIPSVDQILHLCAALNGNSAWAAKAGSNIEVMKLT